MQVYNLTNHQMLNKLLNKLWFQIIKLDRLQYYKNKEKECNDLFIKKNTFQALLEQLEDENKEYEKQVDSLENKLDKLSGLEKEYKKITQLDKTLKIDINYLEDFEPSQIKAMINLITSVQRQVIDDSLTIRVVEWIAHRDWAVRSLWILKSNLQKLLKEIKKKPKED